MRILAARDDGTPLREAREARQLSQNALAKVAGVSSAMVSQLEGRADRRVREDSARRIATALDLELSLLFTEELPDVEPGTRTRPACAPADRWKHATDSAAQRSQREAEEWRAYLERVGTSLEVHEWGRPLSASRAAERFGLNTPRVCEAAAAGRVPATRRVREDLWKGFEWQFDERELAEALTALPRCRWDHCDRPDLNGTGACGEHGQKLWAMNARGTTLPPEVRKRISDKLMERDPAVVDRLRVVHSERLRKAHATSQAQLEDRKRATGFIDVDQAAELFGLGAHSFLAHHVARGTVPIAEVFRGVVGVARLLFDGDSVQRARRDWLSSSDRRARLYLDPDHVVKVRRADGAIERLAERHGLTAAQAEAIVREDATKRRHELLPHRSGRKRRTCPPEHHLEWRDAFYRLRDELEDYADRVGDRPPTDFEVALAVAEEDFGAHPERWSDYRHAPRDPKALHPDFARTAANRVWNAVKPLLSAHSETTAA